MLNEFSLLACLHKLHIRFFQAAAGRRQGDKPFVIMCRSSGMLRRMREESIRDSCRRYCF